MRSIKWFLAFLSVTLILPLTMAYIATTTPPVTIVDDLGRLVTIEKTPERIVSLAPSNTEILFALGLGEKVVGVTDFCDYPPEAKEKEKIGGFATLDIEKIIALAPDLILATGIHGKEVIPLLERRGLTVVALEPKDLVGILYDIVMVGKITGEEEEAFELVAQMEIRIEAVTEKTKPLPEEKKSRVFWVIWPEPIWTTGRGTFIHELIVKAGGKNIFEDLEGWKTVDLEAVIERDPEVIIGTAKHGVSKPAEWAKTEPRLAVTTARKNDRVYAVEGDLVERPGPRIVEGLEEVAKCIHPEIFGKPKGGKKELALTNIFLADLRQ